MLLRLSLTQARAIAQCARATMDAVLDQRDHTPIEIIGETWYARLFCGWIEI